LSAVVVHPQQRQAAIRIFVDIPAFCWVWGALAQMGAESKAAILKESSAASAAPAPNATSGAQHISKRKERLTMLAPSFLLWTLDRCRRALEKNFWSKHCCPQCRMIRADRAKHHAPHGCSDNDDGGN
jgi:hypothetical protein